MRRRKAGPNLTDRGRYGSKLNVTTGRNGGVPLEVVVSAADGHDINFIRPLVYLGLPSIGGLPGRPPHYPELIRANSGDTSQALLSIFERTGIEAETPQRKGPKAKGLRKHRWPIERTIA